MSDFYEKIRVKAYQRFKIPYHKSIAPTISIYAAYLYDAVMIYAQAATEVLLNKGDLRDGKSLMENYIFNRSYSSIQGFDVRKLLIYKVFVLLCCLFYRLLVKCYFICWKTR